MNHALYERLDLHRQQSQKDSCCPQPLGAHTKALSIASEPRVKYRKAKGWVYWDVCNCIRSYRDLNDIRGRYQVTTSIL